MINYDLAVPILNVKNNSEGIPAVLRITAAEK